GGEQPGAHGDAGGDQDHRRDRADQYQPGTRASRGGPRERVAHLMPVGSARGEAIQAVPEQRLGLVLGGLGHSGAPVVKTGRGAAAARKVASAREIWLRTVDAPQRRTAAISSSV